MSINNNNDTSISVWKSASIPKKITLVICTVMIACSIIGFAARMIAPELLLSDCSCQQTKCCKQVRVL